MGTLATVVGNPKAQSRTRTAAVAIAERTADAVGLTVTERTVVDLADLAAQLFDWSSPDVAAAVAAVAAADLRGRRVADLQGQLHRPPQGLPRLVLAHRARRRVNGARHGRRRRRPCARRRGPPAAGPRRDRRQLPTRGLYVPEDQLGQLDSVIDAWLVAAAAPTACRTHRATARGPRRIGGGAAASLPPPQNLLCLEHTGVLLGSMSNRLIAWVRTPVRSYTQSSTTKVRKPYDAVSTTDARTHPLVDSPQTTRLSTACSWRTLTRGVPKKALAAIFSMRTSPIDGTQLGNDRERILDTEVARDVRDLSRRREPVLGRETGPSPWSCGRPEFRGPARAARRLFVCSTARQAGSPMLRGHRLTASKSGSGSPPSVEAQMSTSNSAGLLASRTGGASVTARQELLDPAPRGSDPRSAPQPSAVPVSRSHRSGVPTRDLVAGGHPDLVV